MYKCRQCSGFIYTNPVYIRKIQNVDKENAVNTPDASYFKHFYYKIIK